MPRTKIAPRSAVLLAPCLAATLLAACNEHALKPVGFESEPSPDISCGFAINKDVDVLFVIDNSASMGNEQAILANNFGAFVEVLEAEGVGANYRIGVTTSDNGNPWCPSDTTTPEAGNLVMSSCKDRLGDFVSTAGETDASDIACNDICTLDAAALELLPTTTALDPEPAPRPWLENIEGRKNIPATTSTVDAFKCFAPQGINGCGFESQLESMYLALLRARAPSEASYGFLRDNAILAVVFVTDEADCSYNKSYSEVFDQDGDKVFWSDPEAAFPSSALCWNAGVSCTGDPGEYLSCEAVNKDVDGNEGVDDAEAVLHPLSRYVDLLDRLQQQKRQLDPTQEVILGLIGGVSSEGVPVYRDVSATDPVFQDTFGIGPGCEAVNPDDPESPVQAVPPVRLRELVEAFTPGNMFSICDPDYAGALEAIAEAIEDQILPACYNLCVADTDPSTALVEPECRVEERRPGGDRVRLHECRRDDEGYVMKDGAYLMPAAAVNVCYAMLTDDPAQVATATSSDDMSELCADSNFNLEFEIERRPGFPAAAGTALSATCALADFPEIDCPGIGEGF